MTQLNGWSNKVTQRLNNNTAHIVSLINEIQSRFLKI